jgi:perosamine synthetase
MHALDSSFLTFHHEIGDVQHSFWMCSILVDDPGLRDPLRQHLGSSGIETRPLFYPVHTMNMYQQNKTFPIANNLGSRGINLPSWPHLEKEQVGLICDEIHSFLGQQCLTSRF